MNNAFAKPRVVALVPLRGGSKSIPLKNIRPIAGKPLCAWSLEALSRSRCIDEVYVSTDSPRIKQAVTRLNLGVKVMDRPAAFATDTASTESVMRHFAENVAFDILFTVQATSPLVRAEDFDNAFELLNSTGADSLVTGVRSKRFYWSDDGTPLNYDPQTRPRRQDFAGSIVENGAFYITKRRILASLDCRLGGIVAVYEMPPETEAEIDELDDWLRVEALLRNRGLRVGVQPSVTGPASGRVRVVVCDVDGTLTDGGMYYDANGEALKKFNTRDACGLRRLREQGIDVWVVTGEDSAVVKARLKKLGITDGHFGVKDKLALLQSLCREKSLSLDEIAYIGDDLNDLECLKAVGWPACPKDARPEVISECRFVADANGGDGAVREFCEYILKSNSFQELMSR